MDEQPTVVMESEDRVERVIGKGGNGEVVRVEENGKIYALKKIKKSDLRHPGRRQQQERQIRIMKKVPHPNIVQFYEIVPDERYFIIKMEYVEGVNLNNFILNNTLSIQERKRFGVKVVLDYLSALSALRFHQIVNRDIKPENIMVNVQPGGDIMVKMIDLGQAKTIGNLAQTFVGTPCYMAPEINESEQYTEACDIWSLGITFFQIFQGVHPKLDRQKMLCFPFCENIDLSIQKNQQQFYKTHIKEPLSLSVTRIPDLIRKLIRRMLCPKPEERITFLQILTTLEEGLQTFLDCLTLTEIQQYRSELLEHCIPNQKMAISNRIQQKQIQKKLKALYRQLFRPFKADLRLDHQNTHEDLLIFMNWLIIEIGSSMKQLQKVCDLNELDDSQWCIKRSQLDEIRNYYCLLVNTMQMRRISKNRPLKLSDNVCSFIRKNFRPQELTIRKLINAHLMIGYQE